MIDKSKVKELMLQLKDYSLETYHHSIETAKIAVIIAEQFGYTEEQLEMLYYGAMLHDVGKMKVDKNILHSKNKLSDEEFAEIKKHSQYSYEMLKDFPEEVREIAYHHHEKLNGKGYPNGLTENELSEFDKIVAVADITSALNTKRAYKEQFSAEKITSILNSCVENGELVEKYVRASIDKFVNQKNDEEKFSH